MSSADDRRRMILSYLMDSSGNAVSVSEILVFLSTHGYPTERSMVYDYLNGLIDDFYPIEAVGERKGYRYTDSIRFKYPITSRQLSALSRAIVKMEEYKKNDEDANDIRILWDLLETMLSSRIID